MAPRARFELARDCSHGLSRPALYQAKRPRLSLDTLAGGFRIKLRHTFITTPFSWIHSYRGIFGRKTENRSREEKKLQDSYKIGNWNVTRDILSRSCYYSKKSNWASFNLRIWPQASWSNISRRQHYWWITSNGNLAKSSWRCNSKCTPYYRY